MIFIDLLIINYAINSFACLLVINIIINYLKSKNQPISDKGVGIKNSFGHCGLLGEREFGQIFSLSVYVDVVHTQVSGRLLPSGGRKMTFENVQ